MQKGLSDTNKNVGNNLRSLLNQTGITIVGFSHGAGISLNHARTILKSQASISSRTAEKIAVFFDVEIGQLFLSEEIKLKTPLELPQVANFYQENQNNKNFFIEKSNEFSITQVLVHKLIGTDLFKDWVRSTEILAFIDENESYMKYKNMYNIKAISKALSRIFASYSLIERNDLRGNGKVFQYRRIKQ